MFEGDFTALNRAATLVGVENALRSQRRAAVAEMELVLHWCDLHSADPQQAPGAVPVTKGGDKLIILGGEGTPGVAELCMAELAIARRAGVMATENFAADCLDLRHRLPTLWQAVQDLTVEPWVARRIARLARRLSKEHVTVVDAAVAAAVHVPPGDLIRIAEARIIEADPEGHRRKLAEDATRTGVWLSKVKPGDVVDEVTGEPATRRVSAKLPTGAAIRVEENIEDLAHAIIDHTAPDQSGNVPTLAEARLSAFEMLTTDPHAAASFLDTLDPVTEPVDQPRPRPKRRPASIVVHLTESSLRRERGVARVEDLGPVLLEELHELLGPDRDITVQPVIDLNHVEAVNAYEHPTRIARRTLLRTMGDVFPHSTSKGLERLDIDHPTPYDPNGPPGQTSDRNAAPLTRRHHRAKTHSGYQVQQIALGAYRWTSPNGLCRLVTPRGTRDIEPLHARDGTIIGELITGPRVELALT